MTPAGIEPATFRFVAQHLSQICDEFFLLPLPTANRATAPTHFYYTLHYSVGDVVDESRRLALCFNFGSSCL